LAYSLEKRILDFKDLEIDQSGKDESMKSLLNVLAALILAISASAFVPSKRISWVGRVGTEKSFGGSSGIQRG
jgi:hypothetical protein